ARTAAGSSRAVDDVGSPDDEIEVHEREFNHEGTSSVTSWLETAVSHGTERSRRRAPAASRAASQAGASVGLTEGLASRGKEGRRATRLAAASSSITQDLADSRHDSEEVMLSLAPRSPRPRRSSAHAEIPRSPKRHVTRPRQPTTRLPLSRHGEPLAL